MNIACKYQDNAGMNKNVSLKSCGEALTFVFFHFFFIQLNFFIVMAVEKTKIDCT